MQRAEKLQVSTFRNNPTITPAHCVHYTCTHTHTHHGELISDGAMQYLGHIILTTSKSGSVGWLVGADKEVYVHA